MNCVVRLFSRHFCISRNVSYRIRNEITQTNLQRCYCSTLRGNYNSVSENDLVFFSNLLGERGIVTNPNEVEKYNIDWMKTWKGSSSVVLRPVSTNEVSSIVSYCNERNLAVCPQGGNTGLAGGSVPIFDEIVLSTERMNKIKHFDTITGVLSCQAGCILDALNTYVADKNFIVPLDLGAKGSCHIGGNVATNAGGLRVIRYGSLHATILGLEVVLANGDILDSMNLMRKDNTGYDVKRLFIGSEGTLGIITEVAILCPRNTSATSVAFFGCSTFEHVLKAAGVIRRQLPEVLSSLEMLDRESAETVHENLKISIPIRSFPFYILVEISGSNSTHNEEKLSGCVNTLMEENLVLDGTIAEESSRIQAIWSVRERITEALLQEGYGYKYDISLPLPKFYTIVEILRKKLEGKVSRCCAYGHLGDGNLHFNATTREFDKDVLDTIEPFIYEWTARHGGSISAEHGIGFKKKNYLHLNKTQVARDIMMILKKNLDPKGILNPYKVLG